MLGWLWWLTTAAIAVGLVAVSVWAGAALSEEDTRNLRGLWGPVASAAVFLLLAVERASALWLGYRRERRATTADILKKLED